MKHAVSLRERHDRTMVGEVEETPRGPDSEWIAGIQAQKPDARLPIPFDVDSHVQLWKCRNPRQIWQRAPHYSRHPKRHHADPRRAVELLHLEFPRNERADRGGS